MTPNLPYAAKRLYASTAHATGRLLTRAGLLKALPPERTRTWRHWLYSLPRIHDSVALSELDVPWWTYSSIDAVEQWLAGRARPIRVFEYGSGASTIWLSSRADEVITVEHHRGFAEKIGRVLVDRSNIRLLVREPVRMRRPRVTSQKEGNAGMDFTDYVAAIDEVAGDFDVIVIDGRAREACLAAAGRRLHADGLIIFDNSRRQRYRRAIVNSGLSETVLAGLTPTLPYPEQTSLLRRRTARSDGAGTLGSTDA